MKINRKLLVLITSIIFVIPFVILVICAIDASLYGRSFGSTVLDNLIND